MAKRRGTRTRRFRGGNGGASGYVTGLVGGLNQQMAGSEHGSLTTLSGQNITGAPAPSSINYSLIGGRRRKSRRVRSRKQRGGFWESMVAQAAVPLTLFGLQQSFRRKRR